MKGNKSIAAYCGSSRIPWLGTSTFYFWRKRKITFDTKEYYQKNKGKIKGRSKRYGYQYTEDQKIILDFTRGEVS